MNMFQTLGEPLFFYAFDIVRDDHCSKEEECPPQR